MANEVTIDELQIKIEAESGTAASNLDKLAQAIDRLQAVTQRITGGNTGLNKIAKQIEKLNSISASIQSMQGFEKLERAVDSLKKLDELNNIGDISGFVRNLNKLPQAMNAIAQMPSVDVSVFKNLVKAVKPLNELSKIDISGFVNAFQKIPKAASEMANVDFTALERQITQLSTALEPIVRQAERGGAGLTALAQIMRRTSRTAQQSSNGVGLFNQTIGNIKVKTLAAIEGLRKLYSVLKNGVTASAAYVENLNLFNVTMGESAKEALNFAEKVNAALGVDTSDWIRYQGVFQSIGKGFGIVSQKADVMSKNLTQLTYDISSFYNISADTAAEKLQSALSGQAMPMRQLGFAIEETTLKQVALNHGIEMSVENMTQAQKAQLRYIAIMEQAGNIGVLGDMARTIDTAANGMRVLQARMQQFARAVGNMVMPVLSAVLPYLTAFVQVITEATQSIANFFGFELPKIDFSGASVSSGFDDITNAADEATKANEKFKGSLANIDQLNIIGSKDEDKSGNANQFDLGIELPEYDFLQGIESKTKEIAENIKNGFKEALPWLEAFAAALSAAFITNKIGNFITGLSNLKTAISNVFGANASKFTKTISGIAGGLAAGASSGILFYNSIKNLITGTGKLGNNIAQLGAGLGIAATAIGIFIKTGNPIGAVITAIGAAVGIIAGVVAGLKELDNQLAETITYADNGGISIRGLTDGFKGYFDSITSGYDDILANTAAFKDNEDKINNAAKEVGYLVDKYTILNQTITSEDAEKIKTAVETIGNGISANLGTATRQFVDQLKGSFHDFALQLGKDVDDMVGKFYLLESMGNSALASQRQHLDELTASLQSGELTVEEQKKVFEEVQTTIEGMGTTDVGFTKEQMSFERAIQEMSTSKIDFDKPEVLEAQVTEFNEKAKQARSSVLTSYDDLSYELAQTKSLYENMINPDTGNTIKVDFDIAMGEGAFDKLFADTQAMYDRKKEIDLAKIDTGRGVYLAMLQSQMAENAKQYAEEKTIKNKSQGQSLDYWLGMAETPQEKANIMEAWEKNITDYTAEYYRTDAAKTIQDIIDSAASGIDISGYTEAGKSITEGLANGTIAGQPDLDAAITKIATDSVDTLKTGLDSHSPSKKTEKIGGDYVSGLVLGITENQNAIFSALDYIAVQSIMRLAKIKDSMGDLNFGEINTDKITSDFSFQAPSIGSVKLQQQQGAAREAYSNAAQAANNSNGDSVADININLQSYVELDGEQVGYAVSQFQQRQMMYSNGR